jgi:predicted lipoprotein with Yx(FWY)xxD motif
VGRVTAIVVALGAALVAIVAAWLLGRSSNHGPNAARVRSASPSVRVAATTLGHILVDGRGRTLYLYIKDRGTKSACEGRCARVWPPATVVGTPTAGPGVVAAKLTTTRREDHSRQLVYNGHPLYTLSADVRAGQIGGEGFLGTWYVVSATGSRVGKLSPSSSSDY